MADHVVIGYVHGGTVRAEFCASLLAVCMEGETTVEAVIAAISEERERVIGEAADVLYHLIVLLHARGITLDEVEAELGARTRQSGLDEKAARKSG